MFSYGPHEPLGYSDCILVCWFIFNTILIYLLDIWILLWRIGELQDLGGKGLPREIFHVLYGVIFSALVLNTVLVYFQLWRPFKAEQDRNEYNKMCIISMFITLVILFSVLFYLNPGFFCRV